MHAVFMFQSRVREDYVLCSHKQILDLSVLRNTYILCSTTRYVFGKGYFQKNNHVQSFGKNVKSNLNQGSICLQLMHLDNQGTQEK